MKPSTKFQLFLFAIIAASLIANGALGNQSTAISDTITFNVKTFDGLGLPAQVIYNDGRSKKTILFINGSTPYDEKGNMGAFWNDKGKIIREKHDFYLRFLDIMSNKGYSVATMAKRSFQYPTNIPRPNYMDLALDIKFYIDDLIRRELLKDEKDLVIVGYSEGSIVASKVLGILKKQPHACILLGSATSGDACNYGSIEDSFLTDILRRLKNWNDQKINEELTQRCEIQKALLKMDEEEFEKEYKNSRPFGFGFAQWESFYIDRENAYYDPVPNLLYANVPVLICIGEDDVAMPMTLAKQVFERLSERGLNATFKTIEKEVHQYHKYDVFSIIDTWLDSGFKSTDFILQKSDLLIIDKYDKLNELAKEVSAIPYGGGYPEKIAACFQKAVERNISDETIWFRMGIKLFADHYHDEAYEAFSRATDTTFALCFASLVWMGHLKDLKQQRNEAIALYQKALDVYPGFPMQHDNWKLVIDKTWIRERIKVPFKGLEY